LKIILNKGLEEILCQKGKNGKITWIGRQTEALGINNISELKLTF